MNINMKKKIAMSIVAVVVMASLVTVGTTYAYFFANKEHSSTYQLAKIDTTIEEEFEKTEKENTFLKNPKIKNVGESDCIIRVKVAINPSSNNVELVGLSDNTNWKLNDDGYYYYQGIVTKGNMTTSLFDQVIIKDMKKMEDFDILVYDEAIQTTAYDQDGKKLTAVDETGNYNQANAMSLWKHYK